MGKFSDFIKSSPSTHPPLPLTHICDGFSFRDVVERQEIRVSECDVFRENLIYFFYGRPSYRLSQPDQPVNIRAFMPVCLVLKPEAVITPKRIAPFDTGAFSNGLYSNHIHPKMKMDDFFLECNPDMPGRVVERFYKSNQSYMEGEPSQIKIPPLEFEAEAFYNLISEKGRTLADDRRYSIEIQSDKNVNIAPGVVLLLVLPGVFLDNRLMKRIGSDWNAKIRTYGSYLANPRDYQSVIYSEVSKFLAEQEFV